LGLLGGSLAGVSLLSLGLADPAKSQNLPFGNGDLINLECQGFPTHRWLDGRTHQNFVGLAPTTGGNFTGTRWEVVLQGGDKINLKCRGTLPGNRWLDGVTEDASVWLAPTTGGVYTGTLWQVFRVGGTADQITLKCLGKGMEGNRWLVGRRDHAVGLAPQAAARQRNGRFTYSGSNPLTRG
jgi:hypothetical protein